MLLPHPLILHVINQDLTAQEALDLLLPIVEDPGIDGQCQMLLHWFLVASTKHRTGTGTSLIRLPTAGTTPQGMRQVHVERDEDILFRQLPSLQPLNGRTNPTVLSIL